MYRLAQVSRRHHRPVRRAGRAVRPRVRRPARQPQLRRRAGVAHVLRPRPDRPAAAARRVPGARCARCTLGNVDALPARRDARPRREGRARRPASSSATSITGEVHLACRRTRWCSPPAATATSSTCPPTRRTATSPPRGGRTSAARYFANPCYTQIHPTCIPASDDFQSKLTLMSESLRNDGRIWVPEADATTRARPTRSPRPTATTSSSAATPSFGNLVARDVASRAIKREVDAGPRRRAAEERRLPRLRRRRSSASARTSSRSATATSSRCTSASPTRTRTACRCASTPPSTTRWAGSGSTTTS